MTHALPVAVIMRSKNETPYIQYAIEALKRQTYGPFSLYNVDSGSTDGSLEVVQELNPHPQNITTILPEEYQPGRVLNAMVARTKEPLVVFLNADAIPQGSHWLEHLLAPIMDGRADATFSRQVARPDAYFIVKYDYERAYKRSNIEGKNDDFFSAVACAFKRDLWKERPFYEDGYSEDMEWAHYLRKKGRRFLLVEDSVVEHSHNYTLPQLMHRKKIEAEAEGLIYGRRAHFWRQAGACLREMARDLVYAARQGAWLTIPYNLVYRLVCHIGFYRGYGG